jgi:class 3 adenylate cyclase
MARAFVVAARDPALYLICPHSSST